MFSNSAWNETHDYTYDDTDQLTAADHSVQNDEAYAYDANGNRTGNQTHLGATTSSTVTTNNRITTDGVYHYEYDDEGNRNKRITLVLNPLTGLMEPTGPYEEYTYDHRNRLDQITYKSSSGTVLSFVRYRYDHNNLTVRRIENMYTNGVAGTNTYNLNVHDGNQIVSAFIRGATGGTKLSNRYLWGPQVDQLLSDEQVTSMTAAGTTYWALENQLNSVVDLVTYNAGTDTTSVAKHRAYDSFGNVVSDSARGVTQVFGFTGKMLDAKTGLQWNINRWYDAKLGQWISEDPIGFEGGDGNLRRYVGNAVTSHVDPTGLQTSIDKLLGDPANLAVGTTGLLIDQVTVGLRVTLTAGEVPYVSTLSGDFKDLVVKKPKNPGKVIEGAIKRGLGKGNPITSFLKSFTSKGVPVAVAKDLVFTGLTVEIFAIASGTKYTVSNSILFGFWGCDNYWDDVDLYESAPIALVGDHHPFKGLTLNLLRPTDESIDELIRGFTAVFGKLQNKLNWTPVDLEKAVSSGVNSAASIVKFVNITW